MTDKICISQQIQRYSKVASATKGNIYPLGIPEIIRRGYLKDTKKIPKVYTRDTSGYPSYHKLYE